MTATNRQWTAAALACVVLIASLVTFRHELLEGIVAASRWVDSMGSLAPVLYLIIFTLAVPLFIPTSPLLLAAGMLFNLWPGLALAYLGNTLGGFLAFSLGRSKMRATIRRLMGREGAFEALDRAIAREGVKTAMLIRMSPVLPGPLLNYALGITRLGKRDYLLASIGTLPTIIAFTFVGSTLNKFAQLSNPETMSQLSSTTMPLMVIGGGATILASWLLARRAAKILNASKNERPAFSKPPVVQPVICNGVPNDK